LQVNDSRMQQVKILSAAMRLDQWSEEFIDSVEYLDVDKKVVVVVHQKLKHIMTDQLRYKSSLLTINLGLENRDKINEILLDRLIARLMDNIDS
jgi:nucleoside-triphosphatase THEP1